MAHRRPSKRTPDQFLREPIRFEDDSVTTRKREQELFGPDSPIFKRSTSREEPDRFSGVLTKSLDRQNDPPDEEEIKAARELLDLATKKPSLEDAQKIQESIIKDLRPDQIEALRAIGFNTEVALGDDTSRALLTDERRTLIQQDVLNNFKILTQTLTHEIAHQLTPLVGDTLTTTHDFLDTLGVKSVRVPGLPPDETFASPTIAELRKFPPQSSERLRRQQQRLNFVVRGPTPRPAPRPAATPPAPREEPDSTNLRNLLGMNI